MDDKGQRVLIIDDDPAVRTLLAKYLTSLGYDCFQAGSGQEGIDLIKVHNFQAVFSDIHMPNISGLQLLHKVRETDGEVVVIMVTGVTEASAAVQAMKLGADDYIVKPFSLLEVSSSLNRALQKRAEKPEK